MKSSVQLKTYAKINMSLDVTGVREDGYHEMMSVMQAVDLCDELDLTVSPAPEDTIVLKTDHPEIPDDRRNTAYRAAEKMLEIRSRILRERGETESGIKAEITIRKKIPVAAGLAGGSSDAAGVILGLNSLLELGLKLDKLREAGTQIGADVPFCIMAAAGQQPFLGVKGGAACALAEGIGEILTPLRSIVFWTVLAKPPAAVSTAEVYRLYDTITVRRHPDTSNLMEGMTSGNMQKIKSSMGNVLENVTFNLCPQSRELKQRMGEKGSIAAMMSGSGPTVYALFAVRQKAEALAASLHDLEKEGYRVILTKTL